MRSIATLVGLLPYALIAQTIMLHDGWEFQEQGSEAWYDATVPGTVHTDLLKHGLIPDPYFGTNEDSVQRVSDRNWAYRTTLDVSEEMLGREFRTLRFHGLDTYCDVRLNDSLILEANNMFVRHDVDVKGLLRSKGNTLELLFHPPVKRGDELLEAFGMELPGDEFSKGKKSSMFTRKAAYHYGWDWGPRLVTSGIWRPVELVAWDGARIDRVSVRTSLLRSDKADMMTEVELSGDLTNTNLLLIDPENGDTITYVEQDKDDAALSRIPFTISDPDLWWPNGSGKPTLYEIEVIAVQQGIVVDRKKCRYGIRTVELVQEEDGIGTSFYLNINGRPIFMRGANYIPQDMFAPRVDGQQYRDLIHDVKDANMNMLRVWGGGIYERDLFYELCDENGILVWQDFMFANAIYPDTKDLQENIKQEVEQQVDRLKGHSSVAVWCGNNEVDVAWKNWGWQDKLSTAQKQNIDNNYDLIFNEIIPKTVAERTDQPYIHTSPLSNWGTSENFNHYNMHYWGVWHGPDDFTGYQENVPRFMSEYGFQSFPAEKTLLTVMDSSGLDLSSDAMKAHQKSYVGNGLIEKFTTRYFQEPKNFDDLIYLSQLTQQLGMRTAIKAHRTSPKCMGTLYWQLNDVWPGASWSTRDHGGKWKASMYEVKRLYGPVSVLVTSNGDELAVHVVNDRPSLLKGELVVSVHRLDGTTVHEKSVNVSQAANTRSEVWRSNVTKLVGKKKHEQHYIRAMLLDEEQEVSTDLEFVVDPIELDLQDPNIKIELRNDGKIRISSDVLAYGVQLVLEGTEFSDNFFMLEPQEVKLVTTNVPITPEMFDRITWRSFHR